MITVLVDDEAGRIAEGEIGYNPGIRAVEIGEIDDPHARIPSLCAPGEFRQVPYATIVPVENEQAVVRTTRKGAHGRTFPAYHLETEVSYLEVTTIEEDMWSVPTVAHHIMPKIDGQADRRLVKWRVKPTNLAVTIFGLAGAHIIGRGWVGRNDVAGEVLAILHPGDGLAALYASRTSEYREYCALYYEGEGRFRRTPLSAGSDQPLNSALMGLKTFSVIGDAVIPAGIPCDRERMEVQVGQSKDPTAMLAMAIGTGELKDTGTSIPVMSRGSMVADENGFWRLASEIGYIQTVKFGDKNPVLEHRLIPNMSGGVHTDQALVFWTAVVEKHQEELFTVAGGYEIASGVHGRAPQAMVILRPGQEVRARYVSKDDQTVVRCIALRYLGEGQFQWMPTQLAKGTQIGVYLC